MSDDDRTVHAITPHGCEVVRYDRSGKWYLEASDYRYRVDLADAVRLATQPGATAHLGRPGGSRFDRDVRRARAAA